MIKSPVCMEVEVYTNSKEETQALGAKISTLLTRGDVILLSGDLGAGKTTFVGGVAKGLGISEDVISPTFNIMKGYLSGSLPLYHIDAYRLEGQNVELGLDEFIEGDGACFIEWPQFISLLIPDEVLDIKILNQGDSKRKFVISSNSGHYDAILSEISK